MFGLKFNFWNCTSNKMFSLYTFIFLIPTCLGYPSGDERRYHEDTACDNYELTMLCPATDLIAVKVATYGRLDDLTCIADAHLMTDTHCSLDNALEIIAKKCNGKRSCSITVGQPTFPDPCSGTRKYVNAVWDCVPAIISCPGNLIGVSPERSYRTLKPTNGTWVRDPQQHTNKIYYMAWLQHHTTSTLYEYSSVGKFVANQPTTFHHLDHPVDGTGFVVYDGFLYYNKEPRTIVKYDLGKNQVAAHMELSNANYHGTSPYAVQMDTDIDIAVDENGIWVIYATEGNNGNIVLSRLQKQTLSVLDTWHTSYEKLSALNAFVACGVLYVINNDSLTIDYLYNTTSNSERRANVPFPRLNRTTSAVEYNPKDRMLYVWDSGIGSLYRVVFDSAGSLAPNSGGPRPTTSTYAPPTTITKSTTVSSKPDSNADKGDQSSPHDTSSSSKKSCVGREENGLSWPNTSFSGVALVDCPGSSSAQAMWICGGSPDEPDWITKHPDLSECSSVWMREVKKKMDSGKPSVFELSQTLANQLRKNAPHLTSWDLVEFIELLKRVLQESSSDLSSASAVADAVLKCTSELLRPVLALTWNGLGREIQTRTASSLIDVLEEAAFFLARDMTSFGGEKNVYVPPSQSNSVTWSQPYATLAIRIEPVSKRPTNHKTVISDASRSSPIVTLHSGHGDSIVVSDQCLSDGLKAQDGDKLAIVYLSLKNIGANMVDADGFGAARYPVNSKVVTLSARSLGGNGEWVNDGGRVNLTQPITLHLKHSSAKYAQHACAFWDERQKRSEEDAWWRSGCWRVSGNATHSVCECDHLTSFAILSSDQEFPLMGSDPDWEREFRSLDFLSYINVVRGGMIISAVFLLITFVALFSVSQASDLNTIHKNSVASLMITELVFLVGITQITHTELCTAIAAFLHYGVLCTFFWAALEAAHHLLALHDLHDRTSRWKYYYVIGYVMPAIIVGVSVAVDHSAFGTQAVCWIRTNDVFMLTFIGPCGLAIVATLVLIAVLLCKLSRDRTTSTEECFSTHIRSDAATTCVIMILLCMMWSSSFMWIGGFQVGLTAWLFAIFSASCGVASFVLYCILSPDAILRKCPGSCFKKETNARQRWSAEFNNVTNNGTLLYADGNSSSARHPSLSQRDPAAPQPVQSRIELQPLMTPQVGGALSLDHVIRSKGWHGNRRSSRDDTDPKLPATHDRTGSHTSWNDYVRPGLQNDTRGARVPVSHHCDGNQPTPPDLWPTTSQHCTCTVSTSYSCCYDRLHDAPGPRGSNRCAGVVCNRCKLQKTGPTRPYVPKQRPTSHQYETLGPFPDDTLRPPISGYQLKNRHPYEDIVDADVFCMQVQNAPNPTYAQDLLRDQLVMHSRIERIADPCLARSDPPKRSSWVEANSGRNGRCSDPLFTDQGYDTDSQVPPHCAQSNFHNHRHYQAKCSSRKVAPASQFNPANEQRRSSLSANSESVSENDREVEFINSSLGRASLEESESNASQHYGPPSEIPSPTSVCGSRVHDATLTSADRQVGADAFGTVTSWAAVSGSQLDGAYRYNGGVANRKPVADPKVILGHVQQGRAPRSSIDSIASGAAEEQNTNGYTLPGTVAAGVKARIDLQSGGVSMTTNL